MARLQTLLSFAAVLALAGCNNEPEVTEAETPNAVDVVDTGPEAVQNDAPPAAQAGAASWDADNDKLLDENEFTGFGDQGFLGWDTDDDDAIGPDEFNRGWTTAGFKNGDQAFGLFDANSDRRLERNEFFTRNQFAGWDRNNNGVLEREEFEYYGV